MNSFLLVLPFLFVIVTDNLLGLPKRSWYAPVSPLLFTAFLVIFFLPFRASSEYLGWLILASFSWGYIASVAILRYRSGRHILLTFRHPNTGAILFSSLVAASLGGFQIITAADGYIRGDLVSIKAGFENLCLAVACLSVAFVAYLYYQGQNFITDKGITLQNGETVRWGQIAAYAWEATSTYQLALKLQGHRLKTLSVTLFPDDKAAIVDLLKQHIQQPVETLPFPSSTVNAS